MDVFIFRKCFVTPEVQSNFLFILIEIKLYSGFEFLDNEL